MTKRIYVVVPVLKYEGAMDPIVAYTRKPRAERHARLLKEPGGIYHGDEHWDVTVEVKTIDLDPPGKRTPKPKKAQS